MPVVPSRILLFVALGSFLCVSQSALAQEHPEHPKDAKAAEHPEHPADAQSKVALSKDSLADAIEMLVAHKSEIDGGYFCVYDKKAKEALALTLDKVHRERLASLGDGVYFACADFKATNGKTYDLDVFMKASEHGPFNGLMPTQVTVHKENGEARYTWQENSGIWSMKSVD